MTKSRSNKQVRRTLLQSIFSVYVYIVLAYSSIHERYRKISHKRVWQGNLPGGYSPIKVTGALVVPFRGLNLRIIGTA